MSADDQQLQQIVQRMDDAARLTLLTAKSLAVELETQRELAAQDRVQLARALVLLQRLIGSVDLNALGTERLEQGAQFVAADLAARERRADDAPPIPGAGADAALRSRGAVDI